MKNEVMSELTKEKLCNGLRKIRKNRNITQEQAAHFLGIPRTAFTQIENGNRAISTLEISKLAKLYDCSVEEIIMNNDLYKPWEAYNHACRKLIIGFLDKYYPDSDIDDVYFVGGEKYTGVFECCDRYYSIDFVQECLKLDATFDDIVSYQDYGLECSFQNRIDGICFENWVKYPELRKSPEQQPFTTEEQLKRLLKKCVPALEGITQYEQLLEDINKLIK